MPLDATVGGATSNSFVTLTEYNAYLTDHPYGSAALAMSEAAKTSHLIMAGRILNAQCYEGTAASITQSMTFPRIGLTNRNGYGLTADVVPAEMKYAQMELALILSRSATDPTLQSEAAVQGLTRIKAGSIELEFKGEIEYSSLPASVRGLIPASWFCPSTAVKRITFQMV